MLRAEMRSAEAARVWEAFVAFVVCWTDRDLALSLPTQFAPSCSKSKSFLISEEIINLGVSMMIRFIANMSWAQMSSSIAHMETSTTWSDLTGRVRF